MPPEGLFPGYQIFQKNFQKKFFSHCLFIYLEFWEYRGKAREVLNELIPFIEQVPYTEKQSTKEPDSFGNHLVQGVQFSTRLPLLTLFTVRSFDTLLLMSPDVNHRKVSIDNFNTKTHGKSIKDCILSDNDSSFQKHPIGIYPYKLSKHHQISIGNRVIWGVSLETLCASTIRNREEVYHNSIVTSCDGNAMNVTTKTYLRTLALFNKKRIENDEGQNWNPIFAYDKPIYDNESLNDFLKSCDLQLSFITSDNKFHKNMQLLQQFIMMCNVVQLSFPEGQHRIEAASRPCYGYGLISEAPLIYMAQGGYEQFQQAIYEVRKRSPINDQVPANVINVKNLKDRQTMDLIKLREISQT